MPLTKREAKQLKAAVKACTDPAEHVPRVEMDNVFDLIDVFIEDEPREPAR